MILIFKVLMDRTPIQVAAKRGFPQKTSEPSSKNTLASDPENSPPAKRSRGLLEDQASKVKVEITDTEISVWFTEQKLIILKRNSNS